MTGGTNQASATIVEVTPRFRHLSPTPKQGSLWQRANRRRWPERAIDSLVLAMEERDPYTAGHSRRVQRFALDLAGTLGLERRQCRQLSLAAKLHDIGKVGVPEAILNKPGDLSAEEFARVREHPVVAERILAPIIRNRAILSAIRGHHEQVDGQGYPDGLKGERIPLLARVIAIADCFDAITTARAYRPALTIAAALEVLIEGAGRLYDPRLVDAFVDRSRKREDDACTDSSGSFPPSEWGCSKRCFVSQGDDQG